MSERKSETVMAGKHYIMGRFIISLFTRKERGYWISWTLGNKACRRHSLTNIIVRYQLGETDANGSILLK
jgi:hypothetical protein